MQGEEHHVVVTVLNTQIKCDIIQSVKCSFGMNQWINPQNAGLSIAAHFCQFQGVLRVARQHIEFF